MAGIRLPYINRLELSGRLAADPEFVVTKNNRHMATIRVCNTAYYRDKAGKSNQKTSWFDCVAWGKVADFLAKRFKKGNPVILYGAMTQETWTDKETKQRKSVYRVIISAIHQLEWTEGEDTNQEAQEPPGEPSEEGDVPF